MRYRGRRQVGPQKAGYWADILSSAPRRRRKSWTFETLEARHYFSATPLSAGTVTTLSSNTPEGLQAILDREIAWAVYQDAASQQAGDARSLSLYALPNDPYFQFQWHLLNTGQEVGSPDWLPIFGRPGEDINVAPAWDLGYTGEGVIVAVIDSGTQSLHPDLIGNINLGFQYDAINNSNVQLPDLIDPVNAHGTSVAGLIAAVGNNGIGTTGVAYNAQIVPIRLIDALFPITDIQIANAFRFGSDQVDVYNNSWGPATGRLAYTLTPLEAAALRDSAVNGRDGLGSIQVFASGNNAASTAFGGTYGSAGYNGYINRYTIGVGGIDHDGSYNNADGTITSYMNAGTSILVAAPTGSFPITIGSNPFVGSGIWTTDATGNSGFNVAPLPNGDETDITRDFFPDTNYTSRFNGTSAAAPIVSGVIALMLEANPELTYRDVQEILVRSARQAGEFEIPESGGGISSNLNSWIINPQHFFMNPDFFINGAPAEPEVPDDLNTPDVDEFMAAVPEGMDTVPNNAIRSPRYYVDFNVAGGGTTGLLLNYDDHKQPRPTIFANGAGYTVSQGRGAFGEQFGYGHGVVDAELAVRLAEQWTTLGQTLPGQTTFTTNVVLPTARILAGDSYNEGGSTLFVPGGVGFEDFIEYWEEYFPGMGNQGGPFDAMYTAPDDPFGDSRGGFFHFEIPDSNAQAVEWVEVRVDLNGDANALDFVRMTLVSPDGTVSELNNYFDIEPGTENISRQVPSHPSFIVDPPDAISATDNFVYTFSTNRHWGERYEAQIVIDPLTGNPFLDSIGQVVKQGWELHFENFSGEEFDINSVEVIFHGKSIAAESQRLQGSIGVDSGRFGVGAKDGYFNFDRYFQFSSNIDGDYIDFDMDGRRDFADFDNDRLQDPGEPFTDPESIDFNEISRFADQFQERFAENVVVTATRVSDGVEVAHFVTGADGNFYFDLVPDEYIISITDPLGRTAMDEPGINVPAGTLEHYRQEWHITPEWFFAPQVDNSDPQDFRVEVNPLGVPVAFKEFGSIPIASGIKDLNFLLDPGNVPADQVLVTGQVFADVDGDGVNDGDDVGAPGFVVFADTNESGQFENSDAHVVTAADGSYSLAIPTFETDRFLIGAVPINNLWTQTTPTEEDGFFSVLGGPGDTFSNRDFGFQPESGTFGIASSGSILGVVFQESFRQTESGPVPIGQPGERDAFEPGVSGLRVFNDLDSGGDWDAGEPFAFTADNGAYFLSGVGPGAVRVTVELPPTLEMTNPAAGFRTVVLASGAVATNILFGVKDNAVFDWGDLAGYPTTEAENGPRHVINPGFWLGTTIDGELDGQPTANADGDDLVMGDEDGVVIISNGGLLQPGANTLRVTVDGVGGYLNGWIDWNNNGSWDDAGDQVFVDLDLNPGTYDLVVTSPAGMAGGPLAARFRWGSAHVSYVGADPNFGEVEDYRLANSLQPVLIFAPGDYDSSGLVDQEDYVLWKETYGTADLRADGNNDGTVNAADYTIWRNNKGAQASFGAGAAIESQSLLPSGPSASTLDPAAARAAAYARTLAMVGDLSGPLHYGPNAEATARLLAAGALPMTVPVGDGTQTLYYFPSTTDSTSQTSQPVDTLAAARREFLANWIDHRFSSRTDSHPVLRILPGRHATATLVASVADDALSLLESTWSAYESARDSVALDASALCEPIGKDQKDAIELAMAALFNDEGGLSAGI
jgi:subtilisin family serine protease